MNKFEISKKLKMTATAMLLSTTLVLPAPFANATAAEKAAVTLTATANTGKVKLNKTSATLAVGSTLKLKLKNTKKGAKIKWSSSNPKVAKVNASGKVTAVKNGTATITAKLNGKAYSCTVSVKTLELNKEKVELTAKKTFKLAVDGTTIVKCTSSNGKVATVNNNGLITAKNRGTAVITVITKSYDTFQCTVTVKAEKSKEIDLEGMEIIIRDWWSYPDSTEPSNVYETAKQDWVNYIQDTYNFTIKRTAISDWGSTPYDFIDYVSSGGDDENYVFVLRDDPATTSAMSYGLMYDLSTISWLDFSKDKFTRNKVHERYSYGNSIYGMNTGYSKPGTGVYFNKDILKNAGIDPESIYDMQANGTWTWDAFEELCAIVQRDIDSDGIDDIYGITLDEQNMTTAAVWSNGASFVGKNDKGYFYNLESPATLQALNWCADMYTKYDNHDPEGAQWDYYKKEFLEGKVAFMIEDIYFGTASYNALVDADFDIGFVMFPMGPQGSTYVNCWSNTIYAIPSCYSKEKAEKIAFVLDLYTNEPEGYENYKDLSYYSDGYFDSRALDETIEMMMEPEHGIVEYHSIIPGIELGIDFAWSVGPNANIPELIDAIRDTWKGYIEEANIK